MTLAKGGGPDHDLRGVEVVVRGSDRALPLLPEAIADSKLGEEIIEDDLADSVSVALRKHLMPRSRHRAVLKVVLPGGLIDDARQRPQSCLTPEVSPIVVLGEVPETRQKVATMGSVVVH
jgi:hypothetical protein